MGRTALALTLALTLAGAGCGAGAAGSPQDDAGPADRAPPVDVTPADDAAHDGGAPTDAAHDGLPGDGLPGDGAPGDGAPGDGPAGDGPPPDGPPPDAPPADARPDGGCSQVSLLGNGGFELGQTVWTEYSLQGNKLIYPAAEMPTSLAPQGGGWAAWLGGDDYGADDDLLWQAVSVPLGTTTLRLTGYRYLATAEGTYPWDFVRLQLRDPTDAVLETLLTYSNADTTTTWQAFQVTAQLPYAGSALRFAIHATTDEWGDYTSFLFDTLALEATVCW